MMLELEMVVLLGICLSSQNHRLTPDRFDLGAGIDSGSSAQISIQTREQGMSNMTVQEAVVGTEAGRLQDDLRGVFSKMLSHARTIDMTLTLGDNTEALGQIRELEAYLERGLEVLSRPLSRES